jgi:hypothetical protein
MFIETALNPIIRAPAERNRFLVGREIEYVSLRWSEEILLAVTRSINISPRWGEGQQYSVALLN